MVILDDSMTFDAQRSLRVVSFVRAADDVDGVIADRRDRDELLTQVPRFVVDNDTFLTVSAP